MVRPIATARESRVRPRSLRLVEPAALSPVCVPCVWSFDIHLPASLRSAGVTRLRRYYGRSDSCPTIRPAPGRSLCFMCLAFRSFRLQPPHCPAGRFDTLPFSSRGLSRRDCLPPRVWASPLASRLADQPGRIEFTCVTDESFTSRCFPPLLAETQLRSVTGRRAHA